MHMGIHPKSIYKKPRIRQEYKKPSDAELLPQIKTIIDARPTYGYKRVTAMVNRIRVALGLKKVNKKRIYRIMKVNGLLLPKSPRLRNHLPTGKVMTMFSNLRWCSDCFEIKCFNGEKVYVVFILDCCDREIIATIVKKEPILAIDIQAMMLEAVEKRFNSSRANRQVEFLSDRGSIYRALKTVEMARSLNLKSCFTAAYSPESNGMSEALVKTIKRDYVYVNDCETADSTISMLPSWIKDYNEQAPHSALDMMSPSEYYKTNLNKVA
jgi:putative transposase